MISRCSDENLQIYRSWFSFVDTDGDGRLTGSDASSFFAMSSLSKPKLKQVWALSDSRKQGFLGLDEFITAMQLISLGQEGHEINSALLKNRVNLETLNPPVMEGLADLISKSSRDASNVNPISNGTPRPSSTPTISSVSSKGVKKFSLSFCGFYFCPHKSHHCADIYGIDTHSFVGPVTSVTDGLKRIYIEKLKPLEDTYRFSDFGFPLLTSSDFESKPMVMLLGQYSTGKTTFIKHLLGCTYPGAHIGPEPTTDRFIVVMSGPDERSIPGNTIAVQADMPFGGLTTFGGAFLSKFECSQMPHTLLDNITFVDTPGVLSGEKQRTQRSYDFTGVISWFAAKCDMILLLFDPHKLDISDEFKRVIASLRGNEDKIRVVLNKSDQVDTQQLMRVYGALMWSLGKILNTPEVVRVYIGSFNEHHVPGTTMGPTGHELFEKEQGDLLDDLMDIPKKACDRRVNEIVKRGRAAKIHAYIISHLKKEMPAIMGKSKAQRKLIDNLDNVFTKVQREYHLQAGDFPNVDEFRNVLSTLDMDEFEKLKPKLIQSVDDMLGYDIPNMLKSLRNPYD